MATLQPTIERRQHVAAPLRRVSWGAIFAGAAIATALMVLLTILGLAIGATVIEPDSGDSPSGRAFGIGAGIWWALSGILALFAGGWSAGRLAGLRREWEAPLHGLITWAVTVAALVFLMGSAIGAVVSGAFHVVSTGANIVGRDGHAARALDELRPGGVDAEQVRGEDRSRRGKAADEVRSAAPTEQEAREAADAVADGVAKAAWWTCLFLLLTAVAAAIGSALGAPRTRVGSAQHAGSRPPASPIA